MLRCCGCIDRWAAKCCHFIHHSARVKAGSCHERSGACAEPNQRKLFEVCETRDDVLFANTLTGGLIEYASEFGEMERAKLLLKFYLSALRAGSGLIYILPSVLHIGDDDDMDQALSLARAWITSGDNRMGEAFVAVLSAARQFSAGEARSAKAACLSAISSFEQLGMHRFTSVAESLGTRALAESALHRSGG